jgi:cystathionine beta-lyase/cystathionine gamma-synthase
MSHASVPASLRHVAMPPRDLVRLSIGLEDFADLSEDLAAALGCCDARTEGGPHLGVHGRPR